MDEKYVGVHIPKSLGLLARHYGLKHGHTSLKGSVKFLIEYAIAQINTVKSIKQTDTNIKQFTSNH